MVAPHGSAAAEQAQLPATRLKGETSKAYAAFRTYCELGPERSLKETGKKLNKNTTTLGEWSSKYKWQQRIPAYETEVADIERIATAQAALEHARERQARRDKIEEDVWQVSQRLLGRVNEMLNIPVVERRVAGADGQTIIVKPGKWTFTDVVRAAMALKELGTYAVGMPSTRHALTDKDGDDLVAPVIPTAPDGLPIMPQVVVRVVHETKDGTPITPPPVGGAPAPATPHTQVKHGTTGVVHFGRSG